MQKIEDFGAGSKVLAKLGPLFALTEDFPKGGRLGKADLIPIVKNNVIYDIIFYDWYKLACKTRFFVWKNFTKCPL